MAARVSRRFARGLHEFAEHKGGYVRLDLDPLSKAFEKWDSVHLPEDFRKGVACASWRVIKKTKFRTAHVNLQEARALKLLVRSKHLSGFLPRRVINLTDSKVMLGAFGKGRSSAGKLNQVLRSIMGYSVLRNLFVKNCWLFRRKHC